MNILMATAESLPFSKTGGLADVAYALSKELVRQDNSVSIIVPYYKDLDTTKYKAKKLYSLTVKMNWRTIPFNVIHTYFDGIHYYFVDQERYFKRNNGLYGYFDDGERYAFFSLAVIEFLKKISIKMDIVHVHDWQVGMIPCLLKSKYAQDPVLGKIKTVLTIHNPLFKGYFNPSSLWDLYELDYSLYTEGKVRLDNQVSTLKAAIYFADKITTVSPTHKNELLTPEGSKGLSYDLQLREGDFVGILNGMDYKEFNPLKDPYIYKNWKSNEYKKGKAANKEAFCKEFDLNPNKPLFSVVSRLTDQKGIDLILAMANFAVKSAGQFAVLGSGDAYAEEFFRNLKKQYPENVFVYIGYNNELAHKIYAASDFFIMPSAFEPCGLGQMIAQRYGALPIVRRTGGLYDSVIPFDLNTNNQDVADGFGFTTYSTIDAMTSVAQALMVYNSSKTIMNKLVKNALKVDHTWKKSCQEYIELYKSLL